MSDWARHLPLSHRPRRDESAVTGDRSAATATVLGDLAEVLDARPELLEADTAIAGVTVERALRIALTRMRWSRWQRLLALVGAIDAPSAELAAVDAAALPEIVRVEAAARRASERPTSVRALGEIVVVALDLAARHRVPLTVDPRDLGAVALDLALRVPTERRAVVSARAMRAVDGGWQVGSGRPLYATSAGIVLFLAGRAGVPEELPEPDPPPRRPREYDDD
ncbi:hypothetical protein [Microcella sp.]|uniref:hypothetical protein n=1 Tax=Microcella sp. TaxID=1913979 RepID=UPI00391C18DD